jgi:hypothetical protein
LHLGQLSAQDNRLINGSESGYQSEESKCASENGQTPRPPRYRAFYFVLSVILFLAGMGSSCIATVKLFGSIEFGVGQAA